MYIYTDCDVFFYYFIVMRGWPFVVASLRALGFTTPRSLVIIMLIYVLVFTNDILCRYLLGSLTLLAFELLPTSRAGYLIRLYLLHPLNFVVTAESALRPYGLSLALWVYKPSDLSASPGRQA